MNETTKEKMASMKFSGMLRAYEQTMETNVKNSFTADEMISHLIDAEWDYRYNRRIARLQSSAKFRYSSCFEQIEFKESRKLNKNSLLRLSTCEWIRKGEDLIITGATGVGKSYIACALGNHACLNSFKVFYFNSIKLFSKLKFAKADGSYIKEIEKIKKQDLLILDDFGLEKMDTVSRLTLLEILEDRHGIKSTILTSQLPVKNWHEIIGDPTIADAICDRLVHSSHSINLKGGSMRKKKLNKNSG